MKENKNGPKPDQLALPKGLLLVMIGIFPLSGLFLITSSVWHLIAGIPTGLAFLIPGLLLVAFIGVGVFLILLGWNYYSAVTAAYQYTAEGLLVKYPFQSEKLLPWSCFQQVCVCYTDYSTRGEKTANSVICFVKHGEEKNAIRRWKTQNPFRHRSVICIDYTPELYAQVQAVCPCDIPDLRQTPAYKMYW